MTQGLCSSCKEASLNVFRIFMLCLFLTIFAGCEKPASKLTVLDGVTYAGDAQPRTVMGVSMFGRYKLKFSKEADGKMKCLMTVTIHDGLRGWGQPEVTEIKNLLFLKGVEDRVLLHRDPEISAPGIIKSGQVPDSLKMFNENFDEINLTKAASAEQARGNSGQGQVKAVPAVLMTREKFEEIFGKPFLTSDDISKECVRRYGFSLQEFLDQMSSKEFRVAENYREKLTKNLEHWDLTDNTCSIEDFDWRVITPLLTALSEKYGGETHLYEYVGKGRDIFDDGRLAVRINDNEGHPFLYDVIRNSNFAKGRSSLRYFYDMVFAPWWLEKKHGITGVMFADYKTKESPLRLIRAFYRDQRVLLVREYFLTRHNAKLDDRHSSADLLARFIQLEGQIPLMLRTNIGLPDNSSPPTADPLAVCNLSLLTRGDVQNVTALGNNYLGQLVEPKGAGFGEDGFALMIGDASIFYPIVLDVTEEEWRFNKDYSAMRRAETEEILRQADRENARAAVMEELRRRARQER